MKYVAVVTGETFIAAILSCEGGTLPHRIVKTEMCIFTDKEKGIVDYEKRKTEMQSGSVLG